jgi:hypothetical protein
VSLRRRIRQVVRVLLAARDYGNPTRAPCGPCRDWKGSRSYRDNWTGTLGRHMGTAAEVQRQEWADTPANDGLFRNAGMTHENLWVSWPGTEGFSNVEENHGLSISRSTWRRASAPEPARQLQNRTFAKAGQCVRKPAPPLRRTRADRGSRPDLQLRVEGHCCQDSTVRALLKFHWLRT